MAKLTRTQRFVRLTQLLVGRPGHVWTLPELGRQLGAAKSTVSEDIAALADAVAALGHGTIETYVGSGGGIVYWPEPGDDETAALIRDLCHALSDPNRLLTGGFLYMSDLLFDPRWAARLGEAFAKRFRSRQPEVVVTVETKGIPVALMAAQALNRPLAVIRRDSRVTEGSSLSINYISGTTGRIHAMSLPRRALQPGTRVLLLDDFLKGGGTARGMLSLMAEFEAKVVGLGFVVETRQPMAKRLPEYVALAALEQPDDAAERISVRPGRW